MGSAALAAAAKQTYTSGRGSTTVPIPGVTAGKIVSAVPARLCRVLVTTVLGGALTIYDNASAAAGTIIGVVPSGTAAGTVVDFGMPAANGIFAVLATSGAVTISIE